MNHRFQGWQAVAAALRIKADVYKTSGSSRLNEGQRASLRGIASRIGQNGVVIADEVGMGKTRIVVDLAKCVTDCGGRVAILVPPGLGNQWQTELRDGGLADVPSILRSLDAYLKAWEGDEPKQWFDESVVVVSHNFGNWRLGEKSDAWRWALVPELYAQWRKFKGQRTPRGYQENDELAVGWTSKVVAHSIIEALGQRKRHPFVNHLDGLLDIAWPRHLDRREYAKDGLLRESLQRCVGMGLGMFDLVIVDEAHKSRGLDSGLSQLLEKIIWPKPESSRRVLMTATPVELAVTQWRETLARLALPSDELDLDEVDRVSVQYVDALARLRLTWQTSDEARQAFFVAAKEFQETLSPYLLRRDKREDEDVIQFQEVSKLGIHAYRQQVAMNVETPSLSPAWRKAVCAAEALSVVTQQADEGTAKRMRLTIGSGHGIAKFLDEGQRTDDDAKQEADDQKQSGARKPDAKRDQRTQWWMQTIRDAFSGGEESLLNHPAILKCRDVIEEETKSGEKVLVFGRFTRPLRSLVNLLNAREMLRCLDDHLPDSHGTGTWPQRSMIDQGEGDQWPAIQAAHQQLGSQLELDKDAINARLSAAYDRDENRRKSFRSSLIQKIEIGLGELDNSGRFANAIFRTFKDAAEEDSPDRTNALTLMSRAIGDLLGTATHSITDASPRDCAKAFCQVIFALSDRDNADVDVELDEAEASEEWDDIWMRLDEETTRTRGGFARLMFGETRQESRQMMRLAFNRTESFPRVLVAQSLVGREGLNLHEACRCVVLLHPEWNPGVVEQQIGRVDRVNSHWSRKLRSAIDEGTTGEALPRIEIHPIIFRGTYDEWNWDVLQKRWDNLRAQLHGVIISPSEAKSSESDNDERLRKLVKEITDMAPSFLPTRECPESMV